jgi:hypothetical protein
MNIFKSFLPTFASECQMFRHDPISPTRPHFSHRCQLNVKAGNVRLSWENNEPVRFQSKGPLRIWKLNNACSGLLTESYSTNPFCTVELMP